MRKTPEEEQAGNQDEGDEIAGAVEANKGRLFLVLCHK
jgi:hypothetical protein